MVKGVVTDNNFHLVIGATVAEKGNPSNGVITDLDGKFEISVSKQATALVVSMIGYVTKEAPLTKNPGSIFVTMEESTFSLGEIVVIGYGSTAKRSLTDNVAVIKSDEISNIAVSNFQSTMSGKAAGVQINQTNGKVDAGINIRVRGVASISANSEPLYVLDGMPLINTNESNSGSPMNPLLSLSASEIESIQILKDASSAAIYGARGANGVILITTKKGSAGKPTISLNMSTGVSKASHLLQFLNAAEYRELYTEAAINGLGETDGLAEIEGTFDYLSNGTDWRNGEVDTDWNKLAFRDGKQSDIDLSISGGDAKTQYFFAGGISDIKGILLGNDMRRINARINLKHNFSSKFNAGMNLGVSKSIVERVDNDNSFTTPLQAIAQTPLSPAYLEDGTPNPNTLYPNFLLEDLYANYTTNLRRVTGKVFGEYSILNNLKFNADFGYDFSYNTENQYRGRKTPFMSTNGYAYSSNASSENYILSNYLTYDKVIGSETKLNVVVGQEFNNSDRLFSSVTGTEFPSDDFQTINSAAEIIAGRGESSRYNFLSYFGRAALNIKDKYFVKASVRRDGSSRFGINNRYGIFPAFSVGWILSEESFMKDVDAFSFLKLRASYGKLGNSEIGNFASKTLYNGVSYNKTPGINLEQPGNNDLTWEQSKQFDIGLEFGILKDRLSGELDYYSKNTDGLLFQVPLPGSSGQTSYSKNIGSLSGNGIEVVLNSKNISSGPLRWDTNVNVAKNTNKITELPNANADIIASPNINRVGEAVSSFYLVEFAGADPANGDALYYIDGIGSATTNDYSQANRVIAGHSAPDLIAGLTNEISYNNLSLSFTFVGEWGASIYNGGGVYQSTNADYYDNQTRDQLNRWQNEGDITNVPQARLYGANGTAESTRYLEKASFIKLRNVMLSYTLPKNWLRKASITNARLYVSGVNLLTFTDYSGYDPESRMDSSGYGFGAGFTFYSAPTAKTMSIGINVNF